MCEDEGVGRNVGSRLSGYCCLCFPVYVTWGREPFALDHRHLSLGLLQGRFYHPLEDEETITQRVWPSSHSEGGSLDPGVWEWLEHTMPTTGQMRSTAVCYPHAIPAQGRGHCMPQRAPEGLRLGTKQGLQRQALSCQEGRLAPIPARGRMGLFKHLCGLAGN